MDATQETKDLTVEEIDSRLAENATRLEEIATMLEKKNADLGSTRLFRKPTNMIHADIDRLEHEQRELKAEQEALSQERERVQQAIAQQTAAAAAAEYDELREQLTPLAVEIINGLFAMQKQLDNYEKTEHLMKAKSAIAGKPVAGGVIRIRYGGIGNHIYRLLYELRQYNNPETLEKAGIDILGFYRERGKLHGAPSVSVGFESPIPATNTNEPAQPVTNSIEAAARRGAGLPEK